MFGRGKDGSGFGKFLRKREMEGPVHWIQKYKDAKDLQQGLCVLVLAAGGGTRMNSDLPQVHLLVCETEI
jgi:bifunctional N-acetylglucosamine-1-phosphate-uridyltransferase/glucosamine-1-phosphate-acetyltransferase GlmU-like protein